MRSYCGYMGVNFDRHRVWVWGFVLVVVASWSHHHPSRLDVAYRRECPWPRLYVDQSLPTYVYGIEWRHP